MKRIFALGLMMSFAIVVFPAKADTPDIQTIIKKTEDALNAVPYGTRKMVISIKEGDNITKQWVARYADKVFPDGKRELLVLTEPEDLNGNAHLFWTKDDRTLVEWVYFTTTRRVRKLSVEMLYDSIMGTDFTYADIGDKDPRGTNTLLGEEMLAGMKAYKVETLPKERWYYSRIISWISTDNFLPIQRDYYDSRGRHWKTKLFENIVMINNKPLPFQIQMVDRLRNHSTVLTMHPVSYELNEIPDDAFDPEKLSQVLSSPVCTVENLKKNNIDKIVDSDHRRGRTSVSSAKTVSVEPEMK